jgi:hypothetical protein
MKALLTITLALFPSVSLAVPYNGNRIYRSTIKGENVLILSGQANTRKNFYLPKSSETFKFQGTDECGWAKVNLPEVTVTNFKANGLAKNPYTAPEMSGAYNCNSNSAYAMSGDQKYNPITRTYYFKGSGVNQGITFSWIQPSLRRANYNDCGFVEIKLTGIDLSGTMTIDGSNYQLSSLPVVAHPPLCRIVEGMKVPYVAW